MIQFLSPGCFFNHHSWIGFPVYLTRITGKMKISLFCSTGLFFQPPFLDKNSSLPQKNHRVSRRDPSSFLAKAVFFCSFTLRIIGPSSHWRHFEDLNTPASYRFKLTLPGRRVLQILRVQKKRSSSLSELEKNRAPGTMDSRRQVVSRHKLSASGAQAGLRRWCFFWWLF